MFWRQRVASLALLVACSTPVPPTTLPGAAPFDASLSAQLRQARADRRQRYDVRTQHRQPDDEPQYTNRLVLEDSPYLLQHAHNPVNWFPWGDAAFAEAKRLGRPVLLSIGYSTCHWCHVMEEESFDDEGIATLINQRYVAIKVDREERPDLDALYMAAVVKLSGSGGWPMTVWLTPERAPFWAGTYFPPNDGDRGIPRGLRTLLTTLADTYANQPTQAAAAARDLLQHLQTPTPAPAAGTVLDATTIEAAVTATRRAFDAANGGLTSQRKFPSSTPLRALLRYYRRTTDVDVLRMITTTLDHMAAGGLRDQLGGAFHRYATDAAWQVPHFEIMLYDNALLALTYLEAYQVTGRTAYGQIVHEILDYLAAEMQAPAGGFWSATDADSVGADGRRREGAFFTWTPDELRAALTEPDLASAALRYFGVTPNGTVDGRSVLRVAEPNALDAFGLASVRAQLLRGRKTRPRPAIDKKLVTAWNGLTISAFARAALVFDSPSLATVAARAAETLLAHATSDGRLPRRLVGHQPGPTAVLDDYACLIAGLLDLYEATGTPHWLADARRLEEVVAAHFADPAGGGFFLTADDAEALPVRARPLDDGAEPAGNSVMAMNLLRLAEFTTDSSYHTRAEQALHAAADLLHRSPLAANELLLALDFQLDTPREIVIAVSPDDANPAPFLDRVRARFLPNRVLLIMQARDQDTLAGITPLGIDKPLLGGRTTAYVCEHHVCALPTTDPDQLAAQLTPVQPLRP